MSNRMKDGGELPTYEHEVQKALDLIAKLEKCLA